MNNDDKNTKTGSAQRRRTAILAALLLGWTTGATAGGETLAISVTTTPDPVRAEDPLTFTGTVSNVSASSVSTFTLLAEVPAFTEALLAEAPLATCVESPGAEVCAAGQTLAWSVATLSPGATATRAFSVRVTQNNLPPVGTALSTAFSTSATAGSVGRSAVFGGVAANLSLDAAPFTVGANEPLQYWLTASNVSDQVRTGTLVLQVPPGVAVDSVTDGGVIGAGTVSWSLPDRAPGAIDRVGVRVTPGAVPAGSLLVADADLVETGSSASLARARAVLATNGPLEVVVAQ
ncbi:MAG: hypothetical protein AAFU65_03955, partial [Pseudomonadota bacterium]